MICTCDCFILFYENPSDRLDLYNQSLISLLCTAIYSWVSLCKTLPGEHPFRENTDLEDHPDNDLTATVDSWSDYVVDFNDLCKKDPSHSSVSLPLDKSASEIKPYDADEESPDLALAIGAHGNKLAEKIYDDMMAVACSRGMG